jgi:hypothetical protein
MLEYMRVMLMMMLLTIVTIIIGAIYEIMGDFYLKCLLLSIVFLYGIFLWISINRYRPKPYYIWA